MNGCAAVSNLYWAVHSPNSGRSWKGALCALGGKSNAKTAGPAPASPGSTAWVMLSGSGVALKSGLHQQLGEEQLAERRLPFDEGGSTFFLAVGHADGRQ